MDKNLDSNISVLMISDKITDGTIEVESEQPKNQLYPTIPLKVNNELKAGFDLNAEYSPLTKDKDAVEDFMDADSPKLKANETCGKYHKATGKSSKTMSHNAKIIKTYHVFKCPRQSTSTQDVELSLNVRESPDYDARKAESRARLGILFFLLCLHIILVPFALFEFNNLSDAALAIEIKSSLGKTYTEYYSLAEAYLFEIGNSTGVVFSHELKNPANIITLSANFNFSPLKYSARLIPRELTLFDYFLISNVIFLVCVQLSYLISKFYELKK